jgi:hypothetical protein
MRAHRSGTKLILWGRGLLAGGLIGVIASAAPALLLAALRSPEPGFIGTLAALLTFSVTPLLAVVASAGAILLLAGDLRRWLDRS